MKIEEAMGISTADYMAFCQKLNRLARAGERDVVEKVHIGLGLVVSAFHEAENAKQRCRDGRLAIGRAIALVSHGERTGCAVLPAIRMELENALHALK